MARYFFDIHDTGSTIDLEGSELDSLDEVRAEAMGALPRIAADEIPKDGDRRHFTVLVRDEDGHAVYSATLTYTGLWLGRRSVLAA